MVSILTVLSHHCTPIQTCPASTSIATTIIMEDSQEQHVQDAQLNDTSEKATPDSTKTKMSTLQIGLLMFALCVCSSTSSPAVITDHSSAQPFSPPWTSQLSPQPCRPFRITFIHHRHMSGLAQRICSRTAPRHLYGARSVTSGDASRFSLSLLPSSSSEVPSVLQRCLWTC